VPTTLGHVAIRAHHVRVYAAGAQAPASGASRAPNPALGAGADTGSGENSFPCWLAAATEAPFRVTLYLRLHAPPASSSDFHLQAEISKDVWETFKNTQQPWQVELSPDRLFLLPD
jgi:molybdate transport system permease protein